MEKVIKKKKIVISGASLFSGGTLSVYKDCIEALSQSVLAEKYDVTALVYDKELFDLYTNVNYVEIKKIRKSWFHRMFYELFYYRKLFRNDNLFLWFSIHDVTTRVRAEVKGVYCHNPTPFYKLNAREAFLDPKLWIFTLFYRYLYRLNIKTNQFVVVQQQWIKEDFIKKFNINNVIVAHPIINHIKTVEYGKGNYHGKRVFFYPTFPRVFKNIETICRAAEALLNNRDIIFVITIDGSENRYSRWVVNKFKHLKNVKFIGRIPREDVFSLYCEAEALVFPSHLETWGMPISEFKDTGKPIFLADAKYAIETIGDYDNVSFFSEYNGNDLAEKIMEYLKNGKMYNSRIKLKGTDFSEGWLALFYKMINNEGL